MSRDAERMCPAGEDWASYRAKLDDTLSGLRTDMRALVQNSQSLPRVVDGLALLAERIETNNKEVLEAAIGKEHIPVETVNKMLAQISRNNAVLYRVFGAISLGLLFALIFLLVGEKTELIRNLWH